MNPRPQGLTLLAAILAACVSSEWTTPDGEGCADSPPVRPTESAAESNEESDAVLPDETDARDSHTSEGYDPVGNPDSTADTGLVVDTTFVDTAERSDTDPNLESAPLPPAESDAASDTATVIDSDLFVDTMIETDHPRESGADSALVETWMAEETDLAAGRDSRPDTDLSAETTALDTTERTAGSPPDDATDSSHTDGPPHVESDLPETNTAAESDVPDTDAGSPPPVPPPRPPGCLIPAPGSWASRGALTTNHLPDSVLFTNGVSGMWWYGDANGDEIPEAITSQLTVNATTELPDATVNHSRVSFLNLSSLVGRQGQAAAEARYLVSTYVWPSMEVKAGPGDLNGDGGPDLVAWANDSSRANQYIVSMDVAGAPGGSPYGGWSWWMSGHSAGQAVGALAAMGDWNGDGAMDLYAQGWDSLMRTRGFFLAGPIRDDAATQLGDPYEFARLEGDTYAHPDSIIVADFDGDGFDDFTANDWTPPTSGAVRMWFGPLSGTLNQHHPETNFLSTQPGQYKSFGVRMKRVGDINGDGFEDLVLTDFDATWGGLYRVGVAHVFLGPFVRGATYLDTDAYAHIHWVHPEAFVSLVQGVGDMDGNGTDDFAVRVQNALTDREPPDHRVPIAPLPPGVAPDPVCLPSANEPPRRDTDSPRDTGISPDTDLAIVPSCLPPDPNAFILYEVESAIMVFSNPQPGDLGPEDALFVIKGNRPGSNVALEGLIGGFDLDQDGFSDMAFTSWNLEPEGRYRQRVHVVKPCAELGHRLSP